MRALAVTNPNATGMSPRTRDVIIRALGSELKVDLAQTRGRGHAADLAAEARADGFDLVIAVGGDGTVNEVVSGLLRAGPGPDAPRLAVVPGGSANVFARALGLPPEPIEATGAVIERLRAGRERLIGLGRLRADGFERWFTFCAGFGFDAEVVREVERQRADGAKATPGRYTRTAVREFLRTDRRRPAVSIAAAKVSSAPGFASPVSLVIVTNTTPWTYFGDRPLQPTPQASFDSGLDVFALRRLRAVATASAAWQLFRGHTPRSRQIATLHDQANLELRCARPVAVQVDGEYIGECKDARLDAVPEALAVVC